MYKEQQVRIGRRLGMDGVKQRQDFYSGGGLVRRYVGNQIVFLP